MTLNNKNQEFRTNENIRLFNKIEVIANHMILRDINNTEAIS